MCQNREVHFEQATLYSDSTLIAYEVLKQFAGVNYNLNEFKGIDRVLGDFLFVENRNDQ